MEYIEINLGRILKNIVGLKEEEFEIVETSNTVNTKMDLNRFGDIVIGEDVAKCDDIRDIVSSYIESSGFELTYDSMSYGDYVNEMTFKKTVDKTYSDVCNLLKDYYHFNDNAFMVSANRDEVKVLICMITKFEVIDDLEQASKDYKQLCDNVIKDIGDACGFKLVKMTDEEEDGWRELIFRR